MRKLLFLFLFLGFSGLVIANADLMIADEDTEETGSIRFLHADEQNGGVQKTVLFMRVYFEPADGAESVIVNVKGPGLASGGVDYTIDINTPSPYILRVSKLKPNQNYLFRAGFVYPEDEGGENGGEVEVQEIDWRAEKWQNTQVDFPQKATLKSISQNCPTFVGLSWTYGGKGDHPTYVHIEKSYNDGANWHEVVSYLPATETSYYDGDPNRGVHTTYRVVTLNDLEERIESNEVKIQVKDYVAPDAPINLRVSEGSMSDTSFRLTWDNPEEDGECRTNIRDAWYISVTRAPMYQEEIIGYTYPNSNYYDIWGLDPNEVLDVKVFAVSDQGKIGYPSMIKVKTDGPAVAPTVIIGVAFQDAIKNSAIDVQWQHLGDDADYYIIDVSTDGENYQELGIVKSGVNNLIHMTLSEGLPYTYRVKAVNYKYGGSDWTYMNGYVTHDYTAIPNAPYGLNAKWVDGNVSLTWVDDSNKEEFYIIERAASEDGAFEIIGEVGRNVTSYVDEVSSGTYFYRVRASNPLGESAPSNTASVSSSPEASGFVVSNSIGVLAYPNPTVDNLNISIPVELEGNDVKLKVYNPINQLMLSRTFERTSDIEIDVKRFPPGMYNVVVEVGNFKETKKIIKN